MARFRAHCGHDQPHYAKGLCKRCYKRQYRLAHMEEHRQEELRRYYRQAAKINAIQKAKRAANPETYRRLHREATSRRFARNPQAYDAYKAYQRSYSLAHLAERKASHRAWYLRNRIIVNAKAAAWGRAHPDRRNAAWHRRYAKMRGLAATLTHNEWLAIVERHGHRCFYCGKEAKRLTKDHVVPVADGGGFTAENIVPACQSCNSKKNKMSAEEFIARSRQS